MYVVITSPDGVDVFGPYTDSAVAIDDVRKYAINSEGDLEADPDTIAMLKVAGWDELNEWYGEYGATPQYRILPLNSLRYPNISAEYGFTP